MSISNTLRKAAKLQEKIEQLRGQLAGILDEARSKIATTTVAEVSTVARRVGRPKMLNTPTLKTHRMTGRGRRHTVSKVKPSIGAAVTLRGKRRSPLAGHKRSISPSGPLAPAVVGVLQSSGKAMNVRDILDGLFSSGYKFNSAEPKKNLAARIYRLKGVKQVSAGLFGLA